MPALIALGAQLVLRSAGSARVVALEDFYLDYMKKDLRRGEYVAAVCVPRARESHLVRSYKISKRYDQDISAVCAAFAIDLKDGRIRGARVAFGGMAATPRRARACEQALTGAEWNAATAAGAAEGLALDFQPLTDLRASREYRLRVASNLLQRFHLETTQPDEPANVWRHAI
jgi:xanthine dehydrogenase small subunit